MKIYLSFLLTALVLVTGYTARGQQKFSGTFSNGYKGGKVTFVLSADKKTVKDFTFTGHWRCSGTVESITAGPEKAFPVKNGGVDVVITEPEGGGATAFRFAIKGVINGKAATGTFRMSITALGCDTYLLNWTAQSK